ncbi:hypothetical protein GGR52DRAFT_568934 [Hypoxylon sp. FL1284]|nr:hypothetical protein GGR52DRAFT_568934 [Hypoxylon sp. FL1284]
MPPARRTFPSFLCEECYEELTGERAPPRRDLMPIPIPDIPGGYHSCIRCIWRVNIKADENVDGLWGMPVTIIVEPEAAPFRHFALAENPTREYPLCFGRPDVGPEELAVMAEQWHRAQAVKRMKSRSSGGRTAPAPDDDDPDDAALAEADAREEEARRAEQQARFPPLVLPPQFKTGSPVQRAAQQYDYPAYAAAAGVDNDTDAAEERQVLAQLRRDFEDLDWQRQVREAREDLRFAALYDDAARDPTDWKLDAEGNILEGLGSGDDAPAWLRDPRSPAATVPVDLPLPVDAFDAAGPRTRRMGPFGFGPLPPFDPTAAGLQRRLPYLIPPPTPRRGGSRGGAGSQG